MVVAGWLGGLGDLQLELSGVHFARFAKRLNFHWMVFRSFLHNLRGTKNVLGKDLLHWHALAYCIIECSNSVL